MWIDPQKDMPEDGEVVIGLYQGYWPGRGNGGISDMYAMNQSWANLPDSIKVVGWMLAPDDRHLEMKGPGG